MSKIKDWGVIAAGWILLVVGVIMLPLPGPGIPVIIAGLAILARRSPRARRWLNKLKAYAKGKSKK